MEFLDLFLEEMDVESKSKVQRTSSKEDIKYETKESTMDDDWCLDYAAPPPPQVTSRDVFVKGSAGLSDTSSTESFKTVSYSYINTPKAEETKASSRASKPVNKYAQPSHDLLPKESLEILSDLLISSSEATHNDDDNGTFVLPTLYNSCKGLERPTASYSPTNLVATSQVGVEMPASLPTPYVAPVPPFHNDADLYIGREVAQLPLSSIPRSSDLEGYRASQGYYTKHQNITNYQQLSTSSLQSGVLLSPETIVTPLRDPPLQSPSLCLDQVSVGPLRNLPPASHCIDQIDFCFDSQLSPAPAPAPGQECSYDQNNNQEDEPLMLKKKISNPIDLALLTEGSKASYLKVPKSQELVPSNTSTVQQVDKAGFKTDLSKFYSSTPIAVAPAVQSGQNIIPAMVKNRRSTFFWNVEKHGWSKVKDDTMVNPNNEKSCNTVEFGEDIMLLPPLEKSRNLGVAQYGDNDKVKSFQRSKRRSNKRKNTIKMSDSVFRREIRVTEVHQNPELYGVLNNIRVTSPLIAPWKMKTYADHPIKTKQRSFEHTDVKSTPSNLGKESKVGDDSYVENDKINDGGGEGYPSSPNIRLMCWRCKSRQPSDSWHPHKWQKDKFLCSSCFSFFKKKGKKRSLVKQQIGEVENNDEFSSSEAVLKE